VDLDIVFYGQHDVNSDRLTIPHERYAERSFVLAPLADLAGPTTEEEKEEEAPATAGEATAVGGIVGGAAAEEEGGEMESVDGRLQEAAAHWGRLGGEGVVGSDEIRRVVPVGEELWQVRKCQGAACGVLPSGVPLRVPLVWFIASALRHTSRVVSTTELREKWEGCLHLTA